MILFNYIEVIFWVFFAILVYIYFGYPVVLWILAQFLRVKPERDESFQPSVTLMILAHNEETSIGDRLENALKVDYPVNKLEIIVVSNGSTDKTDEIVRGYASKGIKLLSYKEAGKTNAQNLAVPKANGEIIVFSDADTLHEKNAVKNMVAYFADDRIGLVSGSLSYIKDADATDAMVEKGERAYRGYDSLLKHLESRLGACLVASGCIIAFRKKLYDSIDVSLTEDFVLTVRTLIKGYWNIFAPEAVAFERITDQGGEEYARKKRTIIQGSRAFFKLISELSINNSLILFEMISHKFLRWIAALFLIFVFVSNLLLIKDGFYLIVFVIQVIFYGGAIAGYLFEKSGIKVKYLSIPYFFCMANIAALTGFLKMLCGEKISTWGKIQGTNISNG